MMRIIGVMFVAILAQFIVHGINHLVESSGGYAVQAWKAHLEQLAVQDNDNESM